MWSSGGWGGGTATADVDPDEQGQTREMKY